MLRRALGLSRDAERRPREMLSVMGESVVLRDKRPEDMPDDYEWRCDPELSRLDATRPMQMAYSDYRRYAREEMEYRGRHSRRFAIDTRDGVHIGNCMYYDVDERRGQAELGIMIGDRGYWGRGYGSDAVETLLYHIFTSTGLSRVYLHTLVWNDRARRSFARAGFTEVRPVRRSGMDFIRMEVTRPEWERRLASREAAAPAAGADRAAAPGTVRFGGGGVEPVG